MTNNGESADTGSGSSPRNELSHFIQWNRYKLYIIGGVVMILTAGALALALMSHGNSVNSGSKVDLAIPVADRKPSHRTRAAGSETGPLKHMQLQAQYAGPLKDTVIQRWRDPIDGTICYVYLPILVRHSPPTKIGLVQYGANGIGSISCLQAK